MLKVKFGARVIAAPFHLKTQKQTNKKNTKSKMTNFQIIWEKKAHSGNTVGESSFPKYYLAQRAVTLLPNKVWKRDDEEKDLVARRAPPLAE